MTTIVPVILSGGAGTRLWPVSREAHPKPFMKLQSGESLLQATYLRATGLEDVAQVLVVTNREYYFKTKDELDAVAEQAGKGNVSFLLEPMGRNTAPAVALAARHVKELVGEDAVMLVMPSDHMIADAEVFQSAVSAAVSAAKQGRLVTFGIVPSAPETGYGYIEAGKPLSGGVAREVARFIEKPDFHKAEQFLEQGGFYWNSGIFCFGVREILAAFATHAPDVEAISEPAWAASRATGSNTLHTMHIDAETFQQAPNISIDYAVMERADNVAVVPGDFGWSDVGSWRSFADMIAADENGNKVVGEAVLVDASDNYVNADGRLVAVVGVNDLVIVDTPDALLIGHREKTQKVKEVVEHLRLRDHESARLHRTVHRPWGTYTVLEEGKDFKMKRIVVKPGATLSLQMHHHRSEHWVIVQGNAEVVNGDEVLRLTKDQSTYIPAGHKHRISNPDEFDLVFIEVQTGDYLGEDDIVRFEDKYGRVEKAASVKSGAGTNGK
ncbi:MAG: mannose-1-phosphate guanylyltransferase/mannose-6-phosphate isomerase [Proteobacteria bacterium]|nr:mannose-1-phosphate guanylyltransferase/mannose-6-phosphate isomerase [Pseudomonadota bacterium]